jgi:uncharacterized membrane protein YkoI
MHRRFLFVAALVAALALTAAALAVGGQHGLIRDDGHYAKPGSLDDGKELVPQARITLGQAVAAAQAAQAGELGQVDLERLDGRIVYTVDIGDSEVKVDAADGTVAAIVPRD